MKNIILLLGISLFCYGCGCDKPTTINFSQEDREWIFYKEGQTFNYKNQKGEKRTYVVITIKDTISFQHNAQPAVIFSFCTESYNMPVRKIILKNQTDQNDSVIIDWRKSYLVEKPQRPITGEGNWYGNNAQIYIQAWRLDLEFANSFDTLKMQDLNTPNNISREYILKRCTLDNSKVYENVLYDLHKAYSRINFVYFYHKTAGIIRFETANGDIWELE